MKKLSQKIREKYPVQGKYDKQNQQAIDAKVSMPQALQ